MRAGCDFMRWMRVAPSGSRSYCDHMCGRYADFRASQREADRLSLQIVAGAAALRESYNIAPTQEVSIIRPDGGDLVLDDARWGLVPSWAKDISIGARMINARGETVAEKPSFRAAFSKRRCVLPADGYYEWQQTSSGKQPHFIHPATDDTSILFAGLFEHWRDPSDDNAPWVTSCTIITTAAQGDMTELHDRQPVMLDDTRMEAWLADETNRAELETIITATAPPIAWHPVERAVGNVRHNEPDNIQAI
jgi:putative SOS response-associated peptidase YedK